MTIREGKMAWKASKKRNPPRCNYCQHEATTWFCYPSYYSKLGSIHCMTLTVSACDEHKECANFTSMAALYPEAQLQFAK